MGIRIALAGNPNCGKTTLFNALTGANQYVGNWPGVTVEKKEGKLKKHDDVTVTDLPGIYSLSPYTLEEVVARNYLINERPDVILNLVDGTNLERNLYLTTQLTEIGIPVVVAVNMMDAVKKNGDSINIKELSRQLGCRVVEMSALKGTGVMEAAETAIDAASKDKTIPQHTFSGPVEHAIAHIEEAVIHDMEADRQRWYAIKLFERDSEVIKSLEISEDKLAHIEKDIKDTERELDDDAESIITNERYIYVASVIKSCYKKKSRDVLSTSDKVDRVVTNRIAALPIFVAVMFLVYYIAIGTIGTYVTDWTNDGLLGDGWYLFGIGRGDYEEDYEAFDEAYSEAVEALAEELGIEDVDADVLANAINGATQYGDELSEALYDSSLLVYTMEESDGSYTEVGIEVPADSEAALAVIEAAETEPDNADYGIWIPGASAAAEAGLEAIGASDWIISLVVDGIIGGIAAPLGFVPQMAIVFLLLGFLEDCGYMARVAFIMDRIFRRFGLSGKSFIPFLISSGCGVPGIMATRTIENDKDRKMTMITTTAIPCGAKIPVIMTIAAFLADAWWVAPVMYFIGIAVVIISCLILKKTKMFAGDPAPFVIELPAYHLPMVKNLLLHMWERVWAFIKKAGTILFL
ncbi:MAG: ferrous iron transporter B, partial [Firmicutes bacterium]|nr:ferrous iron transporter B [Bacillota bacterium]